MCTDRGVFFTYVDLRWGITKEQTSHGQTISICLQEVFVHFSVTSIHTGGYIKVSSHRDTTCDWILRKIKSECT